MNRKCRVMLLGLFMSLAAQNTIALPTTEEFSAMLRTCAAGSRIELDADLEGSIAGIYQADSTRGKLSFHTLSDFLKLLPEENRLEGYKLYTQCIGKMLSTETKPGSVKEEPHEPDAYSEQRKSVMIRDVVELRESSRIESIAFCVLRPSDHIVPLQSVSSGDNFLWCHVSVVDSKDCARGSKGYVPAISVPGRCSQPRAL